MTDLKPVDALALYRCCDPALPDFETSDQLPPLEEIFGQTRAVEAVRFAIDIARPGYNLFVLGEPGSSRHDDALNVVSQLSCRNTRRGKGALPRCAASMSGWSTLQGERE